MFDLQRIKERGRMIRPLLVPLIFYIGLLAMFVNWIPDNAESPWRFAFALAPLIPGAIIAFGIVRMIGQLDELERKTLLEGIAISFMLTLLLVVGMSFLEFAGVRALNASSIALFMTITLLLGKLWAMRHYQWTTSCAYCGLNAAGRRANLVKN